MVGEMIELTEIRQVLTAAAVLLVREYVAILFQTRKNKYVLQCFLLLECTVLYSNIQYSIFFLP